MIKLFYILAYMLAYKCFLLLRDDFYTWFIFIFKLSKLNNMGDCKSKKSFQAIVCFSKFYSFNNIVFSFFIRPKISALTIQLVLTVRVPNLRGPSFSAYSLAQFERYLHCKSVYFTKALFFSFKTIRVGSRQIITGPFLSDSSCKNRLWAKISVLY